MKKALLFIGGGVVILVGAIVALAHYGMSKAEREKNQMRTAAARKARHLPKDGEPEQDRDPEPLTENEHEKEIK